MTILLTGDQGYIGTILTSTLIERGYDIGYFANNLLMPIEMAYPKITKDIRDLCNIDLEGVDSIIHTAGLHVFCIVQ